MDTLFLTGLIGSLVLVTGAAWPEGKKGAHPTKSVKNWLFFIGSALMLGYSVMGYLAGGPIFFTILEILIMMSCVMMMLAFNERMEAVVITVGAVGLVIWSLALFQGYNTLIFIVGLASIGMGYVFQMGTLRRNMALTLGSALIALFSYLEASWIFFWLNVFFAVFSLYYLKKDLRPRHRHA